MVNKQNDFFYRVGNQISRRGKINEIRLVGEEFNNIYELNVAIKIAGDMNLDLVEINPNSNPPTCKILDYSKFLYEKKRKKKEQEKQQRKNKQELKELRFRPHTDEHDFNFKKNHAEKFLKKGDKVKAFVFFKGREIKFKEQGELLLLKLANELSEISKAESMPKLEGNKMIMFLMPKK